jgi:hypothetical protein
MPLAMPTQHPNTALSEQPFRTFRNALRLGLVSLRFMILILPHRKNVLYAYWKILPLQGQVTEGE